MADVKWSVYAHKCPNGKVYVGITSRACEDRWRNGNGYRNNKHFFSAIKKYGWDNIIHAIFAKDIDKDVAFQLETFLIALFDSTNPLHGYNHSSGGEGKTGFSPAEETKQKIRVKLTGTVRPDSVREKVRFIHLPLKLPELQEFQEAELPLAVGMNYHSTGDFPGSM